MSSFLQSNLLRIAVLGVLAILLLLTAPSMGLSDWIVTILRGLSVGAVIFLVAAGFSIILGLMDVLNLAQGTLFMIGAYVGWSAYIRPDTVVDLAPPVAFVAAGLALLPLLQSTIGRRRLPAPRLWPWIGLLAALAIFMVAWQRVPLAIWSVTDYQQSPIVWSQAFEGGALAGQLVPATGAGALTWLAYAGLFVSGLLLGVAVVGFGQLAATQATVASGAVRRALITAGALVVGGVLLFLAGAPLTAWLTGLGSNWLFVFAVVVASLTGMGLGALMESTLIRPLYERAIYQIMLTFGLAFIGTEVVRALWGRTGFTMPKPAFFNGSGEGCPAATIGDWLQHGCSTLVVEIAGDRARIRTYNEIFLILVGAVVLVGVWLILHRSRLGMIIRAGVQDREMVEALGINVRQVFTLVFALGVGLAALGGVLAAPAQGLSDGMGSTLLLSALIALAIGGLTSYTGAAVGSVLIGLIQQFMVKFGQTGIPIPFMETAFKPTPSLVPASTVLLMVIVLLLIPQGLFGRKE